MGSGSRIATNILLIISVWFLVDSGFRAKQICKLYFANLFYTSTITVLMFALGVTSSYKELVNGFFPFIRRTNWFIALYICLLLLAPFLQMAFLWNKRKLKLLLTVLTVLIPCVCSVNAFMDTYLDNALYFCYVYLLTGYIKKYLYHKLRINFAWIVAGIGAYLALASMTTLLGDDTVIQAYELRLVSQYLRDFKSIPNMLIAWLVFMWFSKLRMGRVKFINFMSANTMGVYCIHQVPSFHDYLWKTILKCDTFWETKYATIYTVIAVFAVFLAATCVDKIRVRVLEAKFVNSSFFTRLSEKLDNAYKIVDE